MSSAAAAAGGEEGASIPTNIVTIEGDYTTVRLGFSGIATSLTLAGRRVQHATVPCHGRCVGLLIGVKGANVKALSTASACHIDVRGPGKSDDPDAMASLSVSGPTDGVQLVTAVVEALDAGVVPFQRALTHALRETAVVRGYCIPIVQPEVEGDGGAPNPAAINFNPYFMELPPLAPVPASAPPSSTETHASPARGGGRGGHGGGKSTATPSRGRGRGRGGAKAAAAPAAAPASSGVAHV